MRQPGPVRPGAQRQRLQRRGRDTRRCRQIGPNGTREEVRKGLCGTEEVWAEDFRLPRWRLRVVRGPPGHQGRCSGRGVSGAAASQKSRLSDEIRSERGELPALQVVKHPESIGIGCFCVKSTGFLGMCYSRAQAGRGGGRGCLLCAIETIAVCAVCISEKAPKDLGKRPFGAFASAPGAGSVLAAGSVQQFVSVGNSQGAEQEHRVDDGLPHQHLHVVVGGVDEGLEQVDGADADDRQA